MENFLGQEGHYSAYCSNDELAVDGKKEESEIITVVR